MIRKLCRYFRSLGAVFFEEDAVHHLDDFFWVEPSWLLRNLLLHQRALNQLAAERVGADAGAPLVSREELELVLGPSASSQRQSRPRRPSHTPDEQQPADDAGDEDRTEVEDEDAADAETGESDSFDAPAPRQASREPALPPHLVAPYIRLLERYECDPLYAIVLFTASSSLVRCIMFAEIF